MQAASHQFATLAEAKAFALAGNAILTLQSLKTGVHFTYKIRAAKVDPGSTRTASPVWFVNLLSNGSADEGDFQYLGLIRDGRFTLTRASKAGPNAASFKAFNYFWNLGLEQMPAGLVVRHEGHCGRCGRTLTVPESIDAGIGPECAAIMAGGVA